jgi:hypothetical protein
MRSICRATDLSIGACTIRLPWPVRAMAVIYEERSNDQWLAALRGPRKDEALAELRALLVRGLRAL